MKNQYLAATQWGKFCDLLGSRYADGFTDIMIGGAILPSLLYQDPRYFYQGTGSTSSRLRHAILSPFIARRDNGHLQPNYSSVGGDLASAAISHFYYPAPDRDASAVFTKFRDQHRGACRRQRRSGIHSGQVHQEGPLAEQLSGTLLFFR